MNQSDRPRTFVVTGAASGIGRAMVEHVRMRGDRAIGVDLHDADVIADLSDSVGRASLVEVVTELADGPVDAVVAAAGTAGRGPIDVQVDYFGAVATLDGLRPLLTLGHAPRAVVVGSFAAVERVDTALVAACLDGNEEEAVRLAERGSTGHPMTAYASAKRAITRWVRQQAPGTQWAGAGIALNVVAPGIVRTPLTEPMLADPRTAAELRRTVPMPFGGVLEGPAAVVAALAFLTDGAVDGITGQVLFVDGGAECVTRGDDVL